MRAGRESSVKQSARRAFKRLEGVSRIVGPKAVGPRSKRRKQFNLIVLERKRLESASEFDAPILSRKHGEHSADVRLRAGEQVVIEHVPAVDNRQQAWNRVAFPYGAKPTATGTATRREHVAALDISPRNELVAAIAVCHSADLDRCHALPLFRQPLGIRPVVRESAINVNLVRLVEQVWRAEAHQVIIWRGLCLAREYTDEFHWRRCSGRHPRPTARRVVVNAARRVDLGVIQEQR